MTTTTHLFLEPGDRITAQSAAGAPYIRVQSDDWSNTLYLYLGEPKAANELPAALAQLDQLEGAIAQARWYIANRTPEPIPGPDDPDDEPTDEPAVDRRTADLDARRDAILAGSPVRMGGHHWPLAMTEAQAADARRYPMVSPVTESEARAMDGDR